MRFSIHIVEDESIISQDLKEILEDLGYAVKGISRSYDEVIAKLPDLKVDLYLLDIMLKDEKTGIDVASELHRRKLPFLFVSSITEKSKIAQVKETKPYGFIIKPFVQDDVFIALEMARGRIENESYEEVIYLSVGAGKERISLSSIHYAQADGNYTNIFVQDRKFTINDNLKTVHTTLLTHSDFIRIHKSFVVNINSVSKVLKNSLLLKDSVELPKSRSLKLG